LGFNMDTLEGIGASSPKSIPRWVPSAGGLLVAAVVASLLCRVPHVRSLSWAELVSSAVECVTAVFLACGIAVWGLCAIRPAKGRLFASLILRTSVDAVWLAPLALFIRENSELAMAVAAVLVATISRSLCWIRDTSGQAEAINLSALGSAQGRFAIAESAPCFWRQTRSAAAALCAQTGALVGFAGYPVTSALLWGVSSGVWTSSFLRDAPPDQLFRTSSRSASRILSVVALAILLTALGLLPYLRHTIVMGGFGVLAKNHSRLGSSQRNKRGLRSSENGSESAGRRAQQSGEKPLEDSTAVDEDSSSGVILWPKKQAYTKLVSPVPAALNASSTRNRRANPLVIPFNGVYWFFKAPELQPPKTSRQAQGSPEIMEIHSTDRSPLFMEAHESLGSLLDLDCCNKIQIVIRNADRYQGTVSLELILINGSLPGRPQQSLGSGVVNSTRAWKLYEDQPFTSETLNYAIPGNLAIHRFDEIRIVFRLDAFRADDAAKVAIERLVLVPRDL
jgi:hypothetical protein